MKKSREVFNELMSKVDPNSFGRKTDIVKYLEKNSTYSYSTCYKFLHYEYEYNPMDKLMGYDNEEISWDESDILLDFGKYKGKFISQMNSHEEKMYLGWLYRRNISMINAIEKFHID